jgi:hypothetical protein
MVKSNRPPGSLARIPSFHIATLHRSRREVKRFFIDSAQKPFYTPSVQLKTIRNKRYKRPWHDGDFVPVQFKQPYEAHSITGLVHYQSGQIAKIQQWLALRLCERGIVQPV